MVSPSYALWPFSKGSEWNEMLDGLYGHLILIGPIKRRRTPRHLEVAKSHQYLFNKLLLVFQVVCGLCGLHISRISRLKASSPTRARYFYDKPIQSRNWPLRATPLSRAATATKGYVHLAQLIGYSIWISSIPNRPRLPSAWARRPTRLALLGPGCFSRRTFRRRSEATCSLPHPIWMSI